MKENCLKMNFFKVFNAEFLLLRRRKEFTFCGLQGGNSLPVIGEGREKTCEFRGRVI